MTQPTLQSEANPETLPSLAGSSGYEVVRDDLTRIEYYIAPPGRVARNSCIWVLYGRWPLESLVSRNLVGHRYWVRPATPGEIECQEASPRHHYYKYFTLEDLIEDEERAVGMLEAKRIREALEPLCRLRGYVRAHHNAESSHGGKESALGHKSLETTMGYVHPDGMRVPSPLEVAQ